MDWTTLLASLSGSVDEDRLRRNQAPAPHGQGRGCRVGDRLQLVARFAHHPHGLKDDEQTPIDVTSTPLGHTSKPGRDHAHGIVCVATTCHALF